MKKIIAILLLLLLTANGFPALADGLIEPGENDLTMEEAILIAKKAIGEARSFSEEQMEWLHCRARFASFDEMEPTFSGWVVLFLGVRQPFGPFAEDEYGLETAGAVVIGSPLGEIIFESIAPWWDFAEELYPERGDFNFWNVEELGTFDELFIWEKHYALPDEKTISREEALDIAKKAAMDKYPITEEELNAYTPYFQLYYVPMELLGYETNSWMVYFLETDADDNRTAQIHVGLWGESGEVRSIFSVRFDPPSHG